MELDKGVEAVLFYKAAPMKLRVIAEFFEVSEEDVQTACTALQERLVNGATRLITTDTEVELVTAPELSMTIESLRKDDMRRDIGKAGAETLAIVLYRGPLTRIEIDRIRGVNSTFILRNLLIRGLVERRDNPKDQRSFLYASTPELLAHLGVQRRNELPEFEEIMNALDTHEKQNEEREAKDQENILEARP